MVAKKVLVTRREVPPPPPPGAPRTAPRRGSISDAVAFDAAPFEGEEHRQFPRAKMAVRFDAWIGEGDDRRFSASFTSANVSVSGAFLESTFFLPVGTEVRVTFALEAGADPVQARASIIREERPDPRTGLGRSGFGIKFVEFFSQTEVTLAKLFLGAKLRAFAEAYMTSRRARSLNNELDRVVDALAAWELQKVTTPGDPGRPLED
jgi:hypothetical protein